MGQASSPLPTDALMKIASFIRGNTDSIFEAWLELAKRHQPMADASSDSVLRNKLPEFLNAFASCLTDGDVRIPDSFALAHADQREELEWHVESLARDFLMLRRVLVFKLQTELELDESIAIRIGEVFDDAVTTSVSAYVRSREKKLKQANELLERRNYELRGFARVVAHEVRNPLALVTMGSSMARERVNADEKLQRALKLVEEGQEQIEEVLKHLLRYAALGFKQTPGDRVELDACFKQACAALTHLIDTSGARLECEPLPAVLGDEVGLRVIFQNLIENAIKYAGDEQPNIHVSTATAPPTGSGLEVRFRDNGVGIPEDQHERIFGFLTRAATDTSIEGSGIGLAMCRRIAQQHNGSLTVRSEVDKGSVFTLSLPELCSGETEADGEGGVHEIKPGWTEGTNSSSHAVDASPKTTGGERMDDQPA